MKRRAKKSAARGRARTSASKPRATKRRSTGPKRGTGSGGAAAANAQLARRWLDAFNAHDVDALVALYADGCTHTSPKIRHLHPETDGRLMGKAALTAWWKDALERLPSLRYQELSVTADGERVFLEYLRHVEGQPSYPVAEVFEVASGLIQASRVYHG